MKERMSLGSAEDGDEKAHRSLRSTGERLSNLRLGSLRMAFQLPTPHWDEGGTVRMHHQERDWRARTVLHPVTSIWVSSSDHFLRCFFCCMTSPPSRGWETESSAILRSLPFRSGMDADSVWKVRPVSSRKLHAGTRRGEEGSASETRRCLRVEEDEDEGGGAENEKVCWDGEQVDGSGMEDEESC